jgi:elongation factor G
MKVAVEGPGEHSRGHLQEPDAAPRQYHRLPEDEGFARVEAEVPLAEMFGYSTDLRSQTQGKAEFTMEFSRYAPVPREVSEELLKQYKGQAASEDDE